MANAIIIRAYGGSDALQLEPIELGAPQTGEIRIRQTAIGVNYHDVYVRSGLYKTLSLPGIPGCKATGVVEAVGADVAGVKVGDRTCLCHGHLWGLCVAPDLACGLGGAFA